MRSKAPQKPAKDRRHFYPKPAGKPAGSQGDRRAGIANRHAKPENWLYGLHAVQAALANPRRKLGRAVLTTRAAETIGEKLLARVRVEPADADAISRLLPPGAVHQGAALEAEPLPALRSGRGAGAGRPAGRRIVLVLDQISDPHNVGAILRTAAAFGVTAVVVQDRHAPPQSGALAKAASGALEIVPYVEVVNIARALDQLAEHGFWRIALAGDGAQPLTEAMPDRRCGAGAGLGRRRHPPAGARTLRGRRLHSHRPGDGKPERLQRGGDRALRVATYAELLR